MAPGETDQLRQRIRDLERRLADLERALRLSELKVRRHDRLLRREHLHRAVKTQEEEWVARVGNGATRWSLLHMWADAVESSVPAVEPHAHTNGRAAAARS
jgi:hypothetical protein